VVAIGSRLVATRFMSSWNCYVEVQLVQPHNCNSRGLCICYPECTQVHFSAFATVCARAGARVHNQRALSFDGSCTCLSVTCRSQGVSVIWVNSNGK
jgi:hypothetical protein